MPIAREAAKTFEEKVRRTYWVVVKRYKVNDPDEEGQIKMFYLVYFHSFHHLLTFGIDLDRIQ